MTNRPSIPIEVQREVLFEARHRCAVCCEPIPLERAHIRPWNETKEHAKENLIALCANCHSRADSERWGESYLKRYKENPCALAAHAMPPMSAEQKSIVDLIIATDPDKMTEKQCERLVSMVAAYAGIHLSTVTVQAVSPANSLRVRLVMPEDAAGKLVRGFRDAAPELKAFLDDFVLLGVEIVTPSQESSPGLSPAMNIFELRDRLVSDYAEFVTSFVNIRDARIADHVAHELQEGVLWPEPLVQLNPCFEPGDSIDDLVNAGILQEGCRRIFRIKSAPDDRGKPLRLHRHQSDAVRVASQGHNYVLTTGTGSGKSLAYIIPVVDHVLRNGSGRGIQAIIIYPMNALANSQVGELEKFINYGYPNQRGPVTFRRYTGQESDEEKNEIVANPPDILLTNYVMMELILTRPQESNLVRAARGLRFLVLDELHTYRGRQGADVAMLVRRIRESLGAHNLQCVGTSATLASGGAWADQQAEVARATSVLFGAEVLPANVIGENLKKVTTENDIGSTHFIQLLCSRLTNSTKHPETFSEFANDPLAIWIENVLGVRREDSPVRLSRQMPRSLRGAGGIASQLAKITGVEATRCVSAVQETLLAGFHLLHPETGLPVFAFRVHQFISRGDTVYTSLEAENDRYITLHGQQFVPDDRDRVLIPLVFCRECGQEYYSVWREKGDTAFRFTPRDFSERITEEEFDPGYLYVSTANPWPERDTDDFIDRLPDDWVDASGKVQQSRREYLPETLSPE